MAAAGVPMESLDKDQLKTVSFRRFNNQSGAKFFNLT